MITPGTWTKDQMAMTKKDWVSLWNKEMKIVRRGRDVIAAVWGKTEEEEESNAAMITAASDLLAALQELVEVADLRGDSDLPHPADDPKMWSARMAEAWEDARAAIAQAEGRT